MYGNIAEFSHIKWRVFTLACQNLALRLHLIIPVDLNNLYILYKCGDLNICLDAILSILFKAELQPLMFLTSGPIHCTTHFDGNTLCLKLQFYSLPLSHYLEFIIKQQFDLI